MKVILTGGAGFIGSCLLWKLNKNGINDVIVVDHFGASEKWRNLVGKRFSDYIEKGDFLKALEADKYKGWAQLVIHFGACTSTTESDEKYIMANNYDYSKRLAQWCLKQGLPFLYASSAATYGSGELGYSDDDATTRKLSPLNLYGLSKHLFDLWVLENKLTDKLTGFKFFNVFGPNEYHKGDMKSLIAKSFKKALEEKKMRLFKSYKKEYAHGQQKRDFIYVKDAIDMVWYFVENLGKCGIFNIGTGKARSWNDVAFSLFGALGIKADIEYIDMPLNLRDKYQYYTQAELTKLHNAGCRHKCMDLEDAVKDYATYLKNESFL